MPNHLPYTLPQRASALKRMESLGVISKVDTPTPWCAGMIMVPEQDGTVCICVNLKPLNAQLHCRLEMANLVLRRTWKVVWSVLCLLRSSGRPVYKNIIN